MYKIDVNHSGLPNQNNSVSQILIILPLQILRYIFKSIKTRIFNSELDYILIILFMIY